MGDTAKPEYVEVDTMLLQDVTNSLIRDIVAKVGQGPLYSVIAPRGIFTGEPQNKIDDLLPYTWPTHRFATFAVVPLRRHQHPMQPQDRVRAPFP